MHDTAWRENFEHTSAKIQICFRTRQGTQVKITVGIGGRRGDIICTEMDGCNNTPLLISIAAQEALDAVPCAQDRVCTLNVMVLLYKIGVCTERDWRFPCKPDR